MDQDTCKRWRECSINFRTYWLFFLPLPPFFLPLPSPTPLPLLSFFVLLVFQYLSFYYFALLFNFFLLVFSCSHSPSTSFFFCCLRLYFFFLLSSSLTLFSTFFFFYLTLCLDLSISFFFPFFSVNFCLYCQAHDLFHHFTTQFLTLNWFSIVSNISIVHIKLLHIPSVYQLLPLIVIIFFPQHHYQYQLCCPSFSLTSPYLISILPLLPLGSISFLKNQGEVFGPSKRSYVGGVPWSLRHHLDNLDANTTFNFTDLLTNRIPVANAA